MKKITIVFLLMIVALFVNTCLFAKSENEIKNLDIIDSDIRDVLRSFGELGGYNVLMDKNVQGSITIKFSSPVSVKDAIELVAKTYNYQYLWENPSTIIIGNKATFSDYGLMITKVYQLQYATAQQAVEALKVAIPTERVGADIRSNSLTIKGNALEQENVQDIIKGLDREIPQVNIEAKVEEISKDDENRIGFDPSITAGYNGEDALGVFHGKQWFITTSTVLDAYEKEGRSKLLANPNVSTTDNQEGVILIGQKYPIVTKNVDKDGGITYTVTYIDIGTKLTVTPRINKEDVVTVSIKAEISKIGGEVKAGENSYPKIDTREVNSVVRLKEGETFVLSGLVQSEQTTTVTGTPYLSKIPVLGWLFKKKAVTPDTSKEICIFLTPHIVKSTHSEEVVKQSSTEVVVGKENEQSVASPDVAKEDTETKSNETKGELSKEEATTSSSTESDRNANITDEKANEPLATQEDSPNPPPEPIQVVIDEKSPEQSATTTTTTETTPATETQDLKASSSSEREIQYTLKKGETIYQISRRFGVNAKDVLKRNQLNDKDTVKVGQVVVVPIPSDHLYQLKPKETLWRIAKRYGTTIEELMELNGLTNATQVKSGQTIILPTVASNVVNSKY